MMGGRDVIILSGIDWDEAWQAAQEIATRLARDGNRVLFVENTGVRVPGPRDAARIARRLRRWWAAAGSRGVRPVERGLHVCSPLVLPPFGIGLGKALNWHVFLPRVKRAATRLGIRDPVIWTYLPTDTAVQLVRLLRSPRSVVVYYCAGDFARLVETPGPIRLSERAIVEHSDLVLAQCSALAGPLSRWHENVHVIPHGVNLDRFTAREPRGEEQEPGKTTGTGPVIGYVGGLHRFVDFALLSSMAKARPEWSWVLVGPQSAPAGDLDQLPNVEFRGHRPHQELANHMRQFDVCIVPYLKNAYTETIVPTKINEYLAAGKPVVATDLATIVEFNHEHKVLETPVAEPSRFLEAIERALREPNDAATVARRRAVAALSDWSLILERMSSLVDSSLAARSGQESGALTGSHRSP